MASFSMPGVGSGLPFDQWLGQLQAAESKKLTPYMQKQDKYNSQVTTWGKISSSLSTLQSNLKKLSDEGFNGVSVSENKTFKATADEGALPDSFSVAVHQLAKASKVGSAQYENSEKLIGNTAATVEIKLGDGTPMEVTLKNDETSLKYVAQKINEKNGDVTASIIAGDDGKSQLIVTSKKTGVKNEITIDVKGNDDLKNVLKYDGSDPNDGNTSDPNKPTLVAAGQDARFELDGRIHSSDSNTVKDIITGITLELREVSEKDPDDKDKYKTETLTITADTSKVKGLIEDFVKNYNSFLTMVGSATKYTAPDKNAAQKGELIQPDPSNGALFGDGTLRRLTTTLKSTVTGSQPGVSDLYESLGALGIEVKFEEVKEGAERTGTLGILVIDNKKLDAALKNNSNDVEALFLGKGNVQGMKSKLDEQLKMYLGDSDAIPRTKGAIADAVTGLKEQEQRVARQIKAMEMRIEERMKRQENEFLRLDKVIADMNNMQSSLQGALAGLMG